MLIPFALFEALLPLLEEAQIAVTVRDRLANPVPARKGESALLEALGYTRADLGLD